MSKSIYEEAKEIIINSILPRESDKQNKLKVIKALEKAQKQEKLLELYKELSKLKDDVIHSVFFDTDYEHLSVKKEKIEERIKELENDKKILD